MAHTGVVYVRPTIDGTASTFGVSGMLWRDSLILYDRSSRSLWSQISGAAVAGPENGAKLTEVPSVQTTWKQWLREHPDTLVLRKPELEGTRYQRYHDNPEMIGVKGTGNPDPRLPGKTLVFAIEHGGGAAAIPMTTLRERGAVEVSVGDRAMILVALPGDKAAKAYELPSADATLRVKNAGSDEAPRLADAESGGVWEGSTGACAEGPCPVAVLKPVDGRAVYWGIWTQFHPETVLLPEDASTTQD